MKTKCCLLCKKKLGIYDSNFCEHCVKYRTLESRFTALKKEFKKRYIKAS